MSFPLNAYLPAFFGALLVSWLSLPFWRWFCGRIGLMDDPGHRKIHQTPVALAGGFSVLTGIVLPLLAGVVMVHWKIPHLEGADHLLGHGLEQRGLELAAIVAGGLGIVLLGALDDKFELRPFTKLIGQVLVAGLVAVAGVRIKLFIPSLAINYALTMLWIVTVLNAFNFMDNMNGLCVGLGAISAGCLAAIAAFDQDYLVATLELVTCGALVGFLPHNFPSARAFLGDSGSHLVGYLLAIMAILPHFYNRENPRPLALLAPLLMLAVPLGDLAWVVLLRWRLGRPVYHGDNNHLSHRLVRRGFTKRDAVLLIWLIAVGFGALSVALAVL